MYRGGRGFGRGKLRHPPNLGARCTDAGPTALGIHRGCTQNPLGLRTRHTPSFFGMHRIHKGNRLGYAKAVLNGKKKCSVTQFSQKSPRALHMLNHGWWQLAVGGWQLVVGGGWWLVIGGWWLVAVGSGWQLAVGRRWRLAAVGGWRLVAVGG